MKTLRIALIAFVLGFLLTAIGLSQTMFLWNAFHHGGF